MSAAPDAGPRLPSFSLDGAFYWRFEAEIEVALVATALPALFPLEGVTLPGHWTLSVRSNADGFEFSFNHGHLAKGAIGRRARFSHNLYWIDESGAEQSLRSSDLAGPTTFAPNVNEGTRQTYSGYSTCPTHKDLEALGRRTNGKFSPSSRNKYRLVFELQQHSIAPSPSSLELAQRTSSSSTSAVPHNVRLFFPNVKNHGPAELRASEELLSTASPYFRNLFRSGLAENVLVGSKRRRLGSETPPYGGGGYGGYGGRRTPPQLWGRSPPSSPAEDLRDFDNDSDDGTDHLTFRNCHVEMHDPRSSTEFSYKQVKMTQAAYSTVRAVLVWMQTSFMRFAPLSSSCLPQNSDAKKTRSDHVLDAWRRDPKLPLLCSPKSVFRLAHLLDLDDLEATCVAHFTSQLSVETAPSELFSELSRLFKPWRKATLDWVVEHWDDVKKSQKWKDMMERIADDDVDGAGAVMVELIGALDEKRGPGHP
ncbi:hypothetical protein Rhopal_004223-T1 [Rhodotorula paludigena]|uniref:BTB domain-containing protein n=1 Tax=Rhodotorula paludigena TaxID=86838 RepID=A0AAV5GF88_9BASI|nr:hypothetical protein Rhopal_004223-T1 [Rhodotorula paludigena]